MKHSSRFLLYFRRKEWRHEISLHEWEKVWLVEMNRNVSWGKDVGGKDKDGAEASHKGGFSFQAECLASIYWSLCAQISCRSPISLAKESCLLLSLRSQEVLTPWSNDREVRESGIPRSEAGCLSSRSLQHHKIVLRISVVITFIAPSVVRCSNQIGKKQWRYSNHFSHIHMTSWHNFKRWGNVIENLSRMMCVSACIHVCVLPPSILAEADFLRCTTLEVRYLPQTGQGKVVSQPQFKYQEQILEDSEQSSSVTNLQVRRIQDDAIIVFSATPWGGLPLFWEEEGGREKAEKRAECWIPGWESSLTLCPEGSKKPQNISGGFQNTI